MLSLLSTLFSRLMSALRSRRNTSATPDMQSSQPAPPPASSASTVWIDIDQFRRATGLTAVRAQDWYEPVKAASIEFDIITLTRIAAFLAQCGHESGSFRYTSEIWGPTAAQARYDSRADLGNTRPEAIAIARKHGSTPGRWWRGHGILQVTGFDNHLEAGEELGLDLLNDPAQIAREYTKAARASAWWWAKYGCNELADSGDFLALSRRINLGNARSTRMPNGMADRNERWNRAKAALGV